MIIRRQLEQSTSFFAPSRFLFLSLSISQSLPLSLNPSRQCNGSHSRLSFYGVLFLGISSFPAESLSPSPLLVLSLFPPLFRSLVLNLLLGRPLTLLSSALSTSPFRSPLLCRQHSPSFSRSLFLSVLFLTLPYAPPFLHFRSESI